MLQLLIILVALHWAHLGTHTAFCAVEAQPGGSSADGVSQVP